MGRPVSIGLKRAALCGGLALVLGGVVLLYVFDPADGYFPDCLWLSVTGLYCPGCGTSRALHSLLHGHVLVALGYNPLTVVLLPFVQVRLMFEAQAMWSRGRPAIQRFFDGQAVGVLYVVLAFWVARNVPYAPFDWLAP